MTTELSDNMRRWVVVISAALGMAAGFGGMTTVSVLIAPLEGEFNALRTDLSLAYTLITLGVAFGGLAVGRLADRYSTRPIVATGALVVGVAFLLISVQSGVRAIQVIYLTAGLFGFSCLYGPLLTTVSLWFRSGGGIALGIVTAGGTIGQAAVPPVFQALAEGLGWRGACVAIGLAYLVLIVPAMCLIGKPPAGGSVAQAPAAQPWPIPPVISVSLLSIGALLCCLLMATPLVHLIPLAMTEGVGGADASSMMTVMMIAGCAGRVTAGWVSDRLGSLPTYALVSAMQTAAVCLFIQPGPVWSMYVAALVFGLSFGGVMTALVCTIRAAVPCGVLGRAMAAVGLMAWLGMGAGSLQAGLCFDLTGSYAWSFFAAALAGLGNLAVLGVLGLWLRRANSAGQPWLGAQHPGVA